MWQRLHLLSSIFHKGRQSFLKCKILSVLNTCYVGRHTVLRATIKIKICFNVVKEPCLMVSRLDCVSWSPRESILAWSMVTSPQFIVTVHRHILEVQFAIRQR